MDLLSERAACPGTNKGVEHCIEAEYCIPKSCMYMFCLRTVAVKVFVMRTKSF